MSLPILKSSIALTAASAARHWVQTELILSQALAEPLPIEGGRVFCEPALHSIVEANRVLDSFASDEAEATQLIEAIDHGFADRSGHCRSWQINPTVRDSVRAAFEATLNAAAFKKRSIEILTWKWRGGIEAESTPLQIIPARADYAAAERLVGSVGLGSVMAHWLDEARIDSLLAFHERRPVGYVAVVSLGQVGRVMHLFVDAPFRRQGFGSEILRRALEICSRSLFHHVIATGEDPATNRLLQRAGFDHIGEAEEFVAG